MDLKFPHHECEIAQSMAHNGHDSVRYWMHNNMITINGQKMGKSLGNFITLQEFFSGNHELLEQAYSPMTIRFFILQAHYRGTVDFSNEALQASEKALQRMLEGYKRIGDLRPSDTSSVDVKQIEQKCYEALDDDLNTPMVIAALFEAVGMVNRINDGTDKATAEDIEALKALFRTFLGDILGVKLDGLAATAGAEEGALKPFEDAVDLLLSVRAEAKAKKDWATSDLIRNRMSEIGFDVKDTKSGWEWKLK